MLLDTCAETTESAEAFLNAAKEVEANRKAEEFNRKLEEANRKAEEANRKAEEVNRKAEEFNRKLEEANRKAEEYKRTTKRLKAEQQRIYTMLQQSDAPEEDVSVLTYVLLGLEPPALEFLPKVQDYHYARSLIG